MNFKELFDKASGSSFWMWIANRLMWHKVPFNKPHRIKINSFSQHSISAHLPLSHKNRNHLGTVHACAMAALGEYITGVLLLYHLDPSIYRLIMKNISVSYYYQCKTGAHASFAVEPKSLLDKINSNLGEEGKMLLPCTVEVHDDEQNHICTVNTEWQIKDWSKVKTI